LRLYSDCKKSELLDEQYKTQNWLQYCKVNGYFVYEYHAQKRYGYYHAATFCKQIRLVTKGGKSKGKENPLYLRGCETLSVARQGQETPFISHSTPAKKTNHPLSHNIKPLTRAHTQRRRT
jgi:hypothetical protein